MFISSDPAPVVAEVLPNGGMTSVFLPCIPNPTTGFYFFVPTKDIIELPMSPDDAAKLIMSAERASSSPAGRPPLAAMAQAAKQAAPIGGAGDSSESRAFPGSRGRRRSGSFPHFVTFQGFAARKSFPPPFVRPISFFRAPDRGDVGGRPLQASRTIPRRRARPAVSGGDMADFSFASSDFKTLGAFFCNSCNLVILAGSRTVSRAPVY